MKFNNFHSLYLNVTYIHLYFTNIELSIYSKNTKQPHVFNINVKLVLRNALNHDSEPNQLLSLAIDYKRFNILIKKQKTSVFLLKGHNYNVQFFLGVYSIYFIIEYDYLNTKKLAKHDMQSCVLLMSIVWFGYCR